MSLTVLFIAVLHAAPPVLAAALTQNRQLIVLAGSASAIVAVAIGGDGYDILDLLLALLGTWRALSAVTPQAGNLSILDEPEPPPSNRKVPEGTSGGTSGWATLAGIVIAAAAMWFFYSPSQATKSAWQLAPTVQPVVPLKSYQPRKWAERDVHQAKPPIKTAPSEKKVKKNNNDLRHCLNASSNDAVARCVSSR